MERIPIAFEHETMTFSGHFQKVAGAGDTSLWHLMIHSYYFGRLRYTDKWVFDGNKLSEKFTGLSQFFGGYITAWIE